MPWPRPERKHSNRAEATDETGGGVGRERGMNRNLRVVFSKAEPSGVDYVEIARGTWFLGREPALDGEAIPPEVLKGIEKQAPAACNHSKGTITYARAEVRYAMDFESIDP